MPIQKKIPSLEEVEALINDATENFKDSIKNPTVLSSEDLNTLYGDSKLGYYFGGGGNSCGNKPEGVSAFGLFVVKTASGNYSQLMFAGKNNYYDLMKRDYISGSWGEWSYVPDRNKLNISVGCDHEYEITGKTGHEYAVAVPDGPVLIKRINGQTRRKSLNLFKSNGATDSRLTVVENDDGSITLNGTGGLAIVLYNPIYIGKSYTVLLRKISGSMVINSEDASVAGAGIVFDNNFLKEGEVKYYSYLNNTIKQMWVHENAIYTNYRIQLMIVEGKYTADTMPPFEPYDDTLVNSKCNLKSTGRNYFTLDDLESDSGSTISPITKSEFTWSDIGNRNSTAWVNFLTATYNRVGDFYLCFYADSDIKIFNFLNFVSGELWTNRRVHITSNSPNLWMANEGFSNITVRVMVSKEEITYEPYEESSMLVDKELGKYDYIDNVGHLLVKQTSEILTFDGSSDENWEQTWTNVSNKYRYQIAVQDTPYYDLISILTVSNFIDVSANDTWQCEEGVCVDGKYKRLIAYVDDINSVEEFKQWLQEHHLQVAYKLANSTFESINLEAGYQVWNSGLQIQETETIPYVLEKEYAISIPSQVEANTDMINSLSDVVEIIERNALTKTEASATYAKKSSIPTVPDTFMHSVKVEFQFDLLTATANGTFYFQFVSHNDEELTDLGEIPNHLSAMYANNVNFVATGCGQTTGTGDVAGQNIIVVGFEFKTNNGDYTLHYANITDLATIKHRVNFLVNDLEDIVSQAF